MNAYLCGVNLKLYQNEKDYTYHIRCTGLHRNRLRSAFSAKRGRVEVGPFKAEYDRPSLDSPAVVPDHHCRRFSRQRNIPYGVKIIRFH